MNAKKNEDAVSPTLSFLKSHSKHFSYHFVIIVVVYVTKVIFTHELCGRLDGMFVHIKIY